MIELQDVRVIARGRVVIEQATARFPSAGLTLLVGARGSGKTTLLRAIAGLHRHSGTILFDGVDVDGVRSRLYVCFEDAPVIPYLTGYENIRLLLGRDLTLAQVASVAPSLADDAMLRARARELTRGQRRRLHLVAALASNAKHLVFDELFTGADAPRAASVREALARRSPGATLLVAGDYGDRLGATRVGLVDGKLVAVETGDDQPAR